MEFERSRAEGFETSKEHGLQGILGDARSPRNRAWEAEQSRSAGGFQAGKDTGDKFADKSLKTY